MDKLQRLQRRWTKLRQWNACLSSGKDAIMGGIDVVVRIYVSILHVELMLDSVLYIYGRYMESEAESEVILLARLVYAAG